MTLGYSPTLGVNCRPELSLFQTSVILIALHKPAFTVLCNDQRFCDSLMRLQSYQCIFDILVVIGRIETYQFENILVFSHPSSLYVVWRSSSAALQSLLTTHEWDVSIVNVVLQHCRHIMTCRVAFTRHYIFPTFLSKIGWFKRMLVYQYRLWVPPFFCRYEFFQRPFLRFTSSLCRSGSFYYSLSSPLFCISFYVAFPLSLSCFSRLHGSPRIPW